MVTMDADQRDGYQTGAASDRWIQTASGGVFHPLDPRPEEVRLEDIAHALGMKVRYTGHCSRFYSVAEHSAIMAEYAWHRHEDPALSMWCLMHDASEAYLPDIARPIKPMFPGFDVMEDRVLDAVSEALDLPAREGVLWQAVKAIDRRILKTEMLALMPGDEGAATIQANPLPVALDYYDPVDARDFFERSYSFYKRRMPL